MPIIRPRSIFIFLLILLVSCTGSQEYFRSHTDLYKQSGREELGIRFSIVHADDNSSWLYYEIPSSQLTYKYTDFDTVKTATVKISFRLQEKFGLRHNGDTANYIIRDHVQTLSDHQISGRLKIKMPAGRKWFMELHALDMNSGTRGSRSLYVRKENPFSAQNFYTLIPGKGLFDNPYLSSSTGLLINYERNGNLKKLFVDYYRKSFAPAAPPYVVTEETPQFRPDSNFVLTANDTGTFMLAVDKFGFFHCRADTSQKDGMSYFYFNRDFPDVKNYRLMIECARYIMTAEEFNGALSASDKKDAIEKFWLQIAGSPDRAKALIAAWYGRVKDANRYFSSYTEGWKTERGMIYIIFGPPKNIYKTSNSESWVYGDERSARSLTFNFEKRANVFTENDFILERNPLYKNPWFTAVDMWRQGRVYLSK